MKQVRLIVVLAVAVLMAGATGCSREFVGGAAVGAGATGAAYEYQNKKALDDLEADFKAGRISKEEYLRRKDEIQKKSLVY
jgi:hypothetical protein